MHVIKLALLSFLFTFLQTGHSAESHKIDWNDKNLRWLSYENGLNELKKNDKRGVFIFYADWCPTCREYSKLFKDPDVVKALNGLVLIRANRDENRKLSKKFDFDGEYVPRTFALSRDSKIIESAYLKQGEFLYFLPPDDKENFIAFISKVKAAK